MVDVCSSPDFMVMGGMLVVHLTGAAPGPDWVSVECASKAAYGCGELCKKLVKGITLYVRRLGFADLNSSPSIGLNHEAIQSTQEELGVPSDFADLNSSLSIGLNHEAIQSIQEELGVPSDFQGVKEGLPYVEGFIMVADRQVLVLLVTFRRWHQSERTYYLVYDAKDASLYMIPCVPDHVQPTYTVTPVPARPAGCRGHELALAARKFWPQSNKAERGRLCVCTPATRENSASASTGPWEIKVHSFPTPSQAFFVDVMFSFGDKVFWADLSQGVACTDLRRGGSAVFIDLPDGYRIDLKGLGGVEHIDPAKMSRTVGCINRSIKFVCVEQGVTRGDEMVKVWTLDLDHQQWKEDKDLTCSWGEFWKMACLKDDRLRSDEPLEPQYPVLMPDGALCFLLPKTPHRRGFIPKTPDYICSFDMLTRACLCLGQVRGYCAIGPVILPYNFFKNCYPAPKMKPSTHKRKLTSINAQIPASHSAVAQ